MRMLQSSGRHPRSHQLTCFIWSRGGVPEKHMASTSVCCDNGARPWRGGHSERSDGSRMNLEGERQPYERMHIKRERAQLSQHVSLSGRAHSVVLYRVLSRFVDWVRLIVVVFRLCVCVCVWVWRGCVCIRGLVINMHVYQRTLVCVRVFACFTEYTCVWVCDCACTVH